MHFHLQHADIAERFSERRAKAVAVARSRFQERTPGGHTPDTHTLIKSYLHTWPRSWQGQSYPKQTHTKQKLSALATWQVSGLRCFTFTFYFEALLAYVCQSFNTQQHTPLLEFLFRNTELRVESRLVHQTLPVVVLSPPTGFFFAVYTHIKCHACAYTREVWAAACSWSLSSLRSRPGPSGLARSSS